MTKTNEKKQMTKTNDKNKRQNDQLTTLVILLVPRLYVPFRRHRCLHAHHYYRYKDSYRREIEDAFDSSVWRS